MVKDLLLDSEAKQNPCFSVRSIWAMVSMVALEYFVLAVDLLVSAFLVALDCLYLFAWHVLSITDI